MCEWKIILPLLALSILAGCVKAEVLSISTLKKPVTDKAIAVVGYPEETNTNLEFRSYRTKFEQHFRTVGFSIAPVEKADYIAFVSYGIDIDRTVTSLVSTPTYGQIEEGATYTSGTTSTYDGGNGSYSGTNYTMPTYEVEGSSISSAQSTLYKRHLAIDIVEASTLDTDNPRQVYRGRLTSSGRCGAMNEVMDELIEALFSKFPSRSGRAIVGANFTKPTCMWFLLVPFLKI